MGKNVFSLLGVAIVAALALGAYKTYTGQRIREMKAYLINFNPNFARVLTLMTNTEIETLYEYITGYGSRVQSVLPGTLQRRIQDIAIKYQILPEYNV